jgi:dihydrofolate reductase
MRKVYLYMTMSLDGFVAGPGGELDWMRQTPDQEHNDDIVAILSRADTGIMGYPTASGMIPYWADVAADPSASQGQRAIAQAITRIHGIVISNREEEPEWENAELLVVKDDNGLVAAVTELKQRPGRDIGVPGGVRTARTFVRLGLFDEYVLMVHPVVIGEGQSVFTDRVDLELVDAKTYKSGVVRMTYRPR